MGGSTMEEEDILMEGDGCIHHTYSQEDSHEVEEDENVGDLVAVPLGLGVEVDRPLKLYRCSPVEAVSRSHCLTAYRAP